jgi:hypothetical protein
VTRCSRSPIEKHRKHGAPVVDFSTGEMLEMSLGLTAFAKMKDLLAGDAVSHK